MLLPHADLIDIGKEGYKFSLVKTTNLFIFLNILIATIFVAFLGAVPLVGQAELFYSLVALFFALTGVVNYSLGLHPIVSRTFNDYAESIRPRKKTIHFLDPLLI